MTSKTDFTDEEWTQLKRAPFIAGMAISLADPGGPIEAVKETAATLRTVVGAAEGGGRGELVEAIARDVAADAKQRKSPLAGFKPAKGAGGLRWRSSTRSGTPTGSSRRRRRPRTPPRSATGCWPRPRRRPTRRRRAGSWASTPSA